MNIIATIIILIFIIISFTIGILVGIKLKRQELIRLQNEKKEIELKNENLNSKNQEIMIELASEKTKLEMFKDIEKLIKEDFSEIANKIIKEEQSDLREQNREALEEKIKPLKENFEKFREKIEEFSKQGETNTATIKTQIESLMKESFAIKETANDLSNAMKANSQVRGIFGEIILENLLNQAGLINKRDNEEQGNYITQQVFKDELNPNILPRPDAVIFFPDNKHIIIDSKCPLNNFLEYTKSTNEEEKEHQIKLFYKTVTGMITELSGKYNTLEGLNTPEFKLMFIPLESCAGYIYSNKEIISKAAQQNIIIVCPSTLLATLKIINKTWQQKVQAENLSQILKTAANAYDKLVLFLKNIEEIRTKFNSTEKAFEKLFNSATGRGGFIKQIENLRQLGIHTQNRVEEKYLVDNNEIYQE